MKLYFFLLPGIMILFFSCKQTFTPPAISSSRNYLVVEGVINNSNDSTIIKLNYTVNIASNATINPVLNATVVVESDENINYPLTELKNGKYFITNLSLDNSRKYRLSIKTNNNKQYYSDYVPVLNSPPIDSLYYTVSNNNINIISEVHDVTNTVQYYRWEYNETWIIHAAFFSYFKSNGDTVLARDLVNDNIYQCWSSDTSSTIVLNSTSKLKQTFLANNSITSFSLNSEKVANKYSILIKQYALSADAYIFWTNLKKNTEKLGGIFDPQPSQINGNIHCDTDPSEPVIGYISVGSVASKRIFIANQQLPPTVPNVPYSDCIVETRLYAYLLPGTGHTINQVNEYINYNKGAMFPQIPLVSITKPDGTILGFTATTPFCADCTLRGTNRKPDFWK